MFNSKQLNPSLLVQAISDKRHPSRMVSQDISTEYGCFAGKRFHHDELIGVLCGTLFSEKEWKDLTQIVYIYINYYYYIYIDNRIVVCTVIHLILILKWIELRK